MRLRLLSASLIVLLSEPAFAWGPIGHEIVAELSELILKAQDDMDGGSRVQRLSEIVTAGGCAAENVPEEKFAKAEFGGPGTSPYVQSSTWLDDARARFKDDKNNVFSGSSGWHFVNLPMGAKPNVVDYKSVCLPPKLAEGEAAPVVNPATDAHCAVDVIQKAQNILKMFRDGQNLTETQTLARCRTLKTMTHVVGDMHQPLHAIDFDGDRGGNSRPVKLADVAKETNLHSAWDGGILELHMRDKNLLVKSIAQELFDELKQTTAKATKAPNLTTDEMLARTIEEWAWEAHVFGEQMYMDEAGNRNLPKIPKFPAKAEAFAVGPNYMKVAVPIIREQLKRAGVRLADLLNKTL